MNPQYYDSSVGSEESKLNINISNWKIRQSFKKGEKMRLIINLDKQESEAFVNFKKAIKPEGINDDQFIKVIFRHGLEKMNLDIQNLARKYALDNKEDLAASGIVVTEMEDGTISITSSEEPETDE